MSKRQVNRDRRAFNAKKKALGPSQWEAVKLSRKLRAKQRREEMERWLRGEVQQAAAQTVAPDRLTAYHERHARTNAAVAALMVRAQAAAERQAAEEHRRMVDEADDPMVPGSAIWSPPRRAEP